MSRSEMYCQTCKRWVDVPHYEHRYPVEPTAHNAGSSPTHNDAQEG